MTDINLQSVDAPVVRSRDNDGLHKRRGIWHYRLRIAGRWKEVSTHTRNYQKARKVRQQALQDQENGLLPTEIAKWPFARKSFRTEKERLVPLLKVFSGRKLMDQDH